MEKKWNYEKALRETSDSKVKALKKRLREPKDGNNEADAVKEDESVGTQHTGGRDA